MEYIAFDAHKRYTQVSVETADGERRYEGRIAHVRGALQQFLAVRERGSPVAVETVGNWYWIVDEIEAAGQVPQLVHARKAKLMLGMVNKTDKLDARGLNRLQRTGTLPTVWIPPGALRDQRDLPRTRMVLTRERTRLKNRIHATLAKYGLRLDGVSDLFGHRGREWLVGIALPLLPPHSRFATERLLEQLDSVTGQVQAFEERLRAVFAPTPELQLLRTLPGIGWVLAVVIWFEIGDIARFPRAAHLAPGACQRRPHPLRPTPGGHQPVLEVGLRRSREYDLPQPSGPTPATRQSPLSAGPAAEGAPEGDRRGRAPPGGSHLLDPDETGTVPRAASGVVHGGASAVDP
jgi:transposase